MRLLRKIQKNVLAGGGGGLGGLFMVACTPKARRSRGVLLRVIKARKSYGKERKK